MEYIKIELKGYKRFQLNNIQLIRLEPKQLIQLILGTNGSGKSSMLREITPLPSAPAHYEKDGYKHLEILHRGHHYHAINRFDGKTGKYQLIRDGVDIFEGSTATDYRALIKQEFGLTPEIQSLVDGVSKFSLMDVARRRQWFTLLSNADYTYAFEYYGRLKSRIRDLQGSLNITQNRLASELTKVLSETEIQEIKAKVAQYHQILEYLLEKKPRMTASTRELENALHSGEHQLNDRITRVDQLNRVISCYSITRVPGFDLNLQTCQSELSRLQGSVAELERQINDLHQTAQVLIDEAGQFQAAGSLSREEIVKLQEELTLQKEREIQNRRIPEELVYQGSAFANAFEHVRPALMDIMDLFEELPEIDTSRTSVRLAEDSFKNKSQQLTMIEDDVVGLQARIQGMDEIKEHHQQECPSCHHRFIPGYDERQYQGLKADLTKKLALEDQLNKQVEQLRLQLHQTNQVLELQRQYRNLSEHWKILDPLWTMISLKDTYQASRRVVEDVSFDLPSLLAVEVIDQRLQELSDALLVADRTNAQDAVKRQERLDEVESRLGTLQDEVRLKRRRMGVCTTLVQHFTQLSKLRDEIQQILDLRANQSAQLEDSHRVEYFNKLIYLFRQELSNLEQKLSKIGIQQGLIDQYKAQVAEHEQHIKALKLAEAAMSPSTGLIAKGLSGFINSFIARMNQFVKHIWAYPIEIQPVSMKDELELDYKFELLIDERFKANDIKPGECNASTCEIFDLAFRIVAMECLKLKDYPLQLDEFGSSFDHAHRNAAFQVVTSLATSTDVSQIFMVSHFAESYGSLRNADITVLDATNIVLPSDVAANNQTVIN